MKIALKTLVEIGATGRGIGDYTKYLNKELQRLSITDNFEITLVERDAAISEYDLVHYTSFDFFVRSLHITKNVFSVVTIHDTTPLIYPSHYPPGLRGKANLFIQKKTLKKVNAVITDSETSKKDIVRFLDISPDKVFPIYLAPTVNKTIFSDNESHSILNKYNISYPYVLYVGDVNWNKNTLSLCESCIRAKLNLVIVGKMAAAKSYDTKHIENKPLFELQQQYGNSKYINRVGFVSDKELPYLIKNSRLLCQPSYYEGFGLSVLNAMCLGVPTVCSKTQALVEIYEQGSVFFDPYNISNLTDVLLNVFTDKSIRDNLSKKGLKLSKNFNWIKTAKKTLDVYKKCLQIE